MTDDLVKRLRSLGSAGPGRISFLASEDAIKAADRIEKLEAALREIGQTFIAQVKSKPEQWINKMTEIMSHEQAVEAYEEMGRRILIARKALEGKDD